jgi:hypothetical protein
MWSIPAYYCQNSVAYIEGHSTHNLHLIWFLWDSTALHKIFYFLSASYPLTVVKQSCIITTSASNTLLLSAMNNTDVPYIISDDVKIFLAQAFHLINRPLVAIKLVN